MIPVSAGGCGTRFTHTAPADYPHEPVRPGQKRHKTIDKVLIHCTIDMFAIKTFHHDGGFSMPCFQNRIICFVALILMFLLASPSAFGEMSRWNLDHDHTTIGFAVKHMVVSKTRGKFLRYQGLVEMDPEAKVFKTIQATIDTDSIFTDHEKRDAHLRSPDFFDAKTFPTMTYTMKSYQKTGDSYQAVGDLTIRGITKEVTLVGTFNGVAQDPWGNTRAGFTAEGTINRQDFGIKFSKLLDNGGLMVGDDVHITLEVEVIKDKPTP